MFIQRFPKFFTNFFEIPPYQTEDIYEESKYILTCKLFTYITIAMFVLVIVNTIYWIPTKIFPAGVAGLTCYIALNHIKKTKVFTATALFTNVIGAILLVISLYLNPKNPHIVEGLWMINNLVFVFITLGKKTGVFFTIFHTIALTSYYYFFTFEQITERYFFPPNQHDVIGYVISISVAFLTFLYFNWQMINTNEIAAQKLEITSDVLQNQFDTISKQNEEKSVMLKEIHHRVKNNLQLIISLLRLQSREFKNQETIEQFEDAVNRIVTISLVHEKMYQTNDFSQLDIEEYFSSLGNDMIRNHAESSQITFKLDIQTKKIKLKPIVPIALIFNELISNSLKHGKIENSPLTIQFSMYTTSKNDLIFEYSDNGKWKETTNINSFGLELIEALTQQIEGKMTIDKTPITHFTFTMKSNVNKNYVGQ
jgi:two-component sensor histidine kinase